MFLLSNKYIFIFNKYLVDTIQINIYRNLGYMYFFLSVIKQYFLFMFSIFNIVLSSYARD